MSSNDPSAGEAILREARLSWWALWPRVVLGLMALVFVGWGLLRQDHLGYGVAGFGALACLWFVGGALLRRSAMSLKLTDRYVVLQRGIVSRHTSTVMLNRVESLDVDQSLWQRMTASWFILKRFSRVKCRQRSQASRKRLGHLPGKQLRLCQTYSSVHSQPCCFIARISSRT